jgi:carbonic anhydrase/acetyltransferase-like protein (isoleucine patch superfamily)
MKASVISTTHAPPPWGDPPREWKILGVPVAERQRAALPEILSGPPPAGDPVLVLPDDLLVSREFVDAFLAIASTRDGKRPLLACLGPGAAASRSAGRSALPPSPDGSLPLPLLLWQGTQAAAPASLEELLTAAIDAEPVVVDSAEQSREIEVPRAYADEGKTTITASASPRIAIHLRHRTHLLQANLDWLGGEFVRNMGQKSKLLLALRFVWERYLRPGPRRLFSKIGRGCRIHPTAIVEASRLGDGCEIGAYAIVRASVLGAGCTIEDGAHVHMCILDDGARVGRLTATFACYFMEGSHSTQGMMQMGVLGRHTATSRASWFLDVRFDGGNVRVEPPAHDPSAGLLDSGTRFLGCDVGHETVIGAAVLIAPGRMLPSRAKVIADPRGVASKLDERIDLLDAGGAIVVVRDGRLEPLS